MVPNSKFNGVAGGERLALPEGFDLAGLLVRIAVMIL